MFLINSNVQEIRICENWILIGLKDPQDLDIEQGKEKDLDAMESGHRDFSSVQRDLCLTRAWKHSVAVKSKLLWVNVFSPQCLENLNMNSKFLPFFHLQSGCCDTGERQVLITKSDQTLEICLN